MRWYYRFFRRRLTEKRIDAELRFHLEQQIADYIAAGMTPEEARRYTRLEFGGLDQVKEECRDVGAAQRRDRQSPPRRLGAPRRCPPLPTPFPRALGPLPLRHSPLPPVPEGLSEALPYRH